MYLLSFIPFIKKYCITEIVDKNISVIRLQTNFKQEIDNMLLIQKNCVNLKYVKIPDVYEEITEEYPHCILMEYIDGIKINQVLQEDYDIFAKLIIKFGFVTTLIHGVAHGDLHSGNIIFIKDNEDSKNKYKIGVIDFGIICTIDENYKNLLFDILTEIFERPARETAMLVFKFGINDVQIIDKLPKIHYDNIVDFITKFIIEAIYNSKKANQIQLYNCLSKLKVCFDSPEISKFGIKLNENFIKLQLVLAMSHGVTLTLCKYDIVSFADSIINDLFHTNLFID
jgi:predicted unusual protein kinase regulating ubiquinone biosynthesis (AarF/ABC1/UbiB family)